MVRSKFTKAFILSMCITVMSTAAVQAAGQGAGETGSGGGQSSVSSAVAGLTGGQKDISVSTSAGAPADNVASEVIAEPAVNEDVILKQKEIDKYFFEQDKDAAAKMGFTVTHTAPFDTVVEIGITPYSEANAEYLYKVFGKEMIKVVEGDQSIIFASSGAAPDAAVSNSEPDKRAVITEEQEPQAEIYTANAEEKGTAAVDDVMLYAARDAAVNQETAQSDSTLVLSLIAAGAVIVLGGTYFIIRRRKLAGR